MRGRKFCVRCFGLGLYADERCVVDGKRMALSSLKTGEKTIACPACGSNGNPAKIVGDAVEKVISVGDQVVITSKHPRKSLRKLIVTITELDENTGAIKFAEGASSAENYKKC